MCFTLSRSLVRNSLSNGLSWSIIGSGLMGCLAMLAKETGITIIAINTLYDLYLHMDLLKRYVLFSFIFLYEMIHCVNTQRQKYWVHVVGMYSLYSRYRNYLITTCYTCFHSKVTMVRCVRYLWNKIIMLIQNSNTIQLL